MAQSGTAQTSFSNKISVVSTLKKMPVKDKSVSKRIISSPNFVMVGKHTRK
ncbi:hypothetical protein HOLleu_11936 [Holothuria leucospilota]|uniref:Uncharacterized protein n=1 Tax=Holothuria leucospilota TaxID=206669 RepID=A0A9Q1C8E8_HOLLE|nr:hypothetical protein HOLleu_11936 [Holothuria leucospilota]